MELKIEKLVKSFEEKSVIKGADLFVKNKQWNLAIKIKNV